MEEVLEGVRIEVAGIDVANGAVNPQSAIHVVADQRDVVAHHEDREPLVESFQQNVNRYENGTTPHTDFLITLSTKENVSLDWLLLGKGRMRRSR